MGARLVQLPSNVTAREVPVFPGATRIGVVEKTSDLVSRTSHSEADVRLYDMAVWLSWTTAGTFTLLVRTNERPSVLVTMTGAFRTTSVGLAACSERVLLAYFESTTSTHNAPEVHGHALLTKPSASTYTSCDCV